MLNALLLLAAASFGQQSVEKIPLQHLLPDAVIKTVSGKVAGIDRILLDPTDNSIIVQGSQTSIALLRSLVRQIDQEPVVKSLPLRHVDAQYMHDLFKEGGWTKVENGRSVGLVPLGVELTVDARTNSLIAKGPKDSVNELELLLEQIDIPPHNVVLEVQGSIASLDRNLSATNEIANGAVWSYADLTANLKFQVRSFINGDGSVRLHLSGSVAAKEISRTIVLDAGQTCYLRFDPNSLAKDHIVQLFMRDAKIDEAEFLKGTALSKIDPSLALDNNETLKGELRLILRASPK